MVCCQFMLTNTIWSGRSVMVDGDGRVRGGACGQGSRLSGSFGKCMTLFIRRVPGAVDDLAELFAEWAADILLMMSHFVAVQACNVTVTFQGVMLP